MARSQNTLCWSLLLLCVLFTSAVQGDPRQTGVRSITLNRQKRSFNPNGLFGSIPQWWRIRDRVVNDLARPFGIEMSFLNGEEMLERFGKRIAALEQDQDRIINNLRQILATLREPCSPLSPGLKFTSPSLLKRPTSPEHEPTSPSITAGASGASSPANYQSTPVRPPKDRPTMATATLSEPAAVKDEVSPPLSPVSSSPVAEPAAVKDEVAPPPSPVPISPVAQTVTESAAVKDEVAPSPSPVPSSPVAEPAAVKDEVSPSPSAVPSSPVPPATVAEATDDKANDIVSDSRDDNDAPVLWQT